MEEARNLNAEKVEDLVDLCRRSHAVTLHAPVIPTTEKMMGATQFEVMPDAVFLRRDLARRRTGRGTPLLTVQGIPSYPSFEKEMSGSWQVEAIQPASSRRLSKAAPGRRTRKWPVRCVVVAKRNWQIGTPSFRLIH